MCESALEGTQQAKRQSLDRHVHYENCEQAVARSQKRLDEKCQATVDARLQEEEEAATLGKFTAYLQYLEVKLPPDLALEPTGKPKTCRCT